MYIYIVFRYKYAFFDLIIFLYAIDTLCMNDLFLIQWGIKIIGLIHTSILYSKILEDMKKH